MPIREREWIVELTPVLEQLCAQEARRVGLGAQDHEDVLQEVCLRIWSMQDRGRRVWLESGSWLRILARNVARENARKAVRFRSYGLDLACLPAADRRAPQYPKSVRAVLREYGGMLTARQFQAVRAQAHNDTVSSAARSLRMDRSAFRRCVARGCAALSIAARSAQVSTPRRRRPPRA